MTMRLADSVRSAACNGVVGTLDVGSGTAKLQLYSGSKPANVGDTPDGELLAEFDLPDPVFGGPSNGQATANSITGTTGTAAAGSGTEVGFARALDKDGMARWDNDDVGASDSQIQLNTTTITDGVNIAVESWTVTAPAT